MADFIVYGKSACELKNTALVKYQASLFKIPAPGLYQELLNRDKSVLFTEQIQVLLTKFVKIKLG